MRHTPAERLGDPAPVVLPDARAVVAPGHGRCFHRRAAAHRHGGEHRGRDEAQRVEHRVVGTDRAHHVRRPAEGRDQFRVQHHLAHPVGPGAGRIGEEPLMVVGRHQFTRLMEEQRVRRARVDGVLTRRADASGVDLAGAGDRRDGGHKRRGAAQQAGCLRVRPVRHDHDIDLMAGRAGVRHRGRDRAHRHVQERGRAGRGDDHGGFGQLCSGVSRGGAIPVPYRPGNRRPAATGWQPCRNAACLACILSRSRLLTARA